LLYRRPALVAFVTAILLVLVSSLLPLDPLTVTRKVSFADPWRRTALRARCDSRTRKVRRSAAASRPDARPTSIGRAAAIPSLLASVRPSSSLASNRHDSEQPSRKGIPAPRTRRALCRRWMDTWARRNAVADGARSSVRALAGKGEGPAKPGAKSALAGAKIEDGSSGRGSGGLGSRSTAISPYGTTLTGPTNP
jgi:hypothetical protein